GIRDPLVTGVHVCSSDLAKPLFVCRQTGTSLEMIEKHYGDARVDADQLDEMIGELESPTGNLPGTLPDAGDDSLPSKVKEPFVRSEERRVGKECEWRWAQ